jgi:hypothetical protein
MFGYVRVLIRRWCSLGSCIRFFGRNCRTPTLRFGGACGGDHACGPFSRHATGRPFSHLSTSSYRPFAHLSTPFDRLSTARLSSRPNSLVFSHLPTSNPFANPCAPSRADLPGVAISGEWYVVIGIHGYDQLVSYKQSICLFFGSSNRSCLLCRDI